MVGLFALTFLSTIPYHNSVLNNFSSSLFTIPTPPNSKVVQQEKKIGVLLGNGNHCDYYAGLAVKSSLKFEEFKNWYTKNYHEKWNLHFVDVANVPKDWDSITRVIELGPSKDLFDTSSTTQANYIVYLAEHSLTERIGDLRCS